MRPKIHIIGGYRADNYQFQLAERFPHVGQLAEMKKIANQDFVSRGDLENETQLTADDTYLNIDHYLWTGRSNARSVDSGYIITYDPSR